ncbi:MAG: hypothetical protein AB8H79_23405 [Myxococcota bacterium]
MRRLLCVLLVAGCGETGLREVLYGTLEVTPSSVVLDGGCGYEERTVTLASVGENDLEIASIALEGQGWSLLQVPSVPLSIPPGSQVDLLLLGNEGDASLTIETNEPGVPAVVVPLTATQSAAPSIAWVSPANDEIVPPGAELVVQVQDADDPVEELVVRWSSDVDGTVGVGFGDEAGQSASVWGEGTAGDHVLTATVTDSCGTTDFAEVSVCRQDGYASGTLDLSTWAMNGTAVYDEVNDWVQLTDLSSPFQLGSAFQTTGTTGDNVQLAFSFYVSGGTGADGFAVTALDTTRASTYVAQSGGCLGYGGGGICGAFEPLYGWNVEVDTYYSGGLDPTTADHLSFHFDGDVAGYEAFAALPEMEDGAWHDMTIQVVAPRVTITVDGVTYIDEDIEGFYTFPAEVGFTAATGGETNFHLIRNLAVIENVCE